MVMIDIFDFHLEICAHGVEDIEQFPDENAEYLLQTNDEQAQAQENGLNEGSWNAQENMENPEAENASDSYEEDFDPSTLTYEQLMTLDNFVVKKGMTEKEMEQIPMDVHLNEFDGAASCSVCISDLESGEIIRKLPCGHRFHRGCIDTWLEQNITCPICKKYLR